jgi:hypothetical protein
MPKSQSNNLSMVNSSPTNNLLSTNPTAHTKAKVLLLNPKLQTFAHSSIQ